MNLIDELDVPLASRLQDAVWERLWHLVSHPGTSVFWEARWALTKHAIATGVESSLRGVTHEFI